MVELGKMVAQVHIEARHGGAVEMKKGQKIKVIDVQGKQVCDFFALRAGDPAVYLSSVYTRSTIGRMRPRVGDPIFNNLREQFMIMEEDTVGRNDMLYAP
ncbi:MAG: urea carboxylase-associated family protein [Chloroflexi bacterium]|nr:urea carboxylase-associated family protein [Chloroflexota bacterium]MCH9036923.1 urea carboxylase-associated family protein [Chloroflexota bacterium]